MRTQFRSPTVLLALIPGQVAFDYAYNAFSMGDYLNRVIYSGIMVGEQIGAVMTFGEAQVILNSIKPTVKMWGASFDPGKRGLQIGVDPRSVPKGQQQKLTKENLRKAEKIDKMILLL